MEILRKIFSFMSIAITAFTSIICPTPASTQTAEITNEICYSLIDAFAVGQGLDEQDGVFYTSGSLAGIKLCCLGKIDMSSGEFTLQNLDALPMEFKMKDYDHIGDISVDGDIIYAPVEDKAEKYPLVLLYDAENLQYTGTHFELDATYLTDGIPWCATDENYLYTSKYHDATEIVVYNKTDMSFSHIIELSEPLDRVQAGDAENGVLYLNCDPIKQNKTVYTVDLLTGETALLCDRNITGYDTEAEGLCASENDGEITLYVGDYNKLISTFIRTYKVK